MRQRPGVRERARADSSVRSVWECAGACGSLWVSGARDTARERAGVDGSVWERTGVCGNVRERAGACGSVRERAGVFGSVRVGAGACGGAREREGACASVPNMGVCGSARERAGARGSARECAGARKRRFSLGDLRFSVENHVSKKKNINKHMEIKGLLGK